MLKRIISFTLLCVMLLSMIPLNIFAEKAPTNPFEDVTESDWFCKEVLSVNAEGIMTGKSATVFDPRANISRAEVVTALARFACVNVKGKGDSLTFPDTQTDAWYSDYVGWAFENGIVTGYDNGNFGPADLITRQELAVVLSRMIKYLEASMPENPQIDKFTDGGKIASWVAEHAETMRKAGLMKGDANGNFNATNNASRAEVATIISRMLPHSGRIAVVENGKSDYVIVIDENDSAAKDAAERMAWQLRETCGVTVNVCDDDAKTKSKEIVLGKTSRGEKADVSGMIRTSYAIAVDGEKVYIDGATADGLYGGVVNFMNNYIKGDSLYFTEKSSEVNEFEYPIGKLTISGNDISKYSIYYPAGVSDSVRSAAENISLYIEEATGVTIPVKEGRANEFGIILETVKSNASFDDSYTVKSVGSNVVISGHENAGVIYGAVDFIENCIGWRLNSDTVDYIEPTDKVDIKGLDYSVDPLIDFRYRSWDQIVPSRIPVWAGSSNHTFEALAPGYSSMSGSQPCLTDEKIYEIMLDSALALLEANPDANMISISQNDNSNYCKCDNCAASDAKYGAPSGTLLAFVNRIAEVIEKKYPDVLVHTFAYDYTVEAPDGITAGDNVFVQICNIFECQSHSLTDPCNEESYAEFKKWSDIAKQVGIWDYPGNWACHYIPNPIYTYDNLHGLYSNFADLNPILYYSNSYMGNISGEFAEMRYHLAGRFMWDPYFTEDEYNDYVESFIKAYYGPGYKEILDTIALMQEKTATVHVEYANVYHSSPSGMFGMYFYRVIDELIAGMNSARLKTVTKSQWEHVDRAMIQYEFIKLNFVFDKLYGSSDPAEKQLSQDMSRALFEKFEKYRMDLGNIMPDSSKIVEFTVKPDHWEKLVASLQ